MGYNREPEQKLKLCPFCGGTAWMDYACGKPLQVICKQCGAWVVSQFKTASSQGLIIQGFPRQQKS